MTVPGGQTGQTSSFRAALAGLLRNPNRPHDDSHPAYWTASFIRRVGVPAAFGFLILRAWEGSLAEERTLRSEQHAAIIAALDRNAVSFAATTGALKAVDAKLDQRLADMASTTEWLKGAVSARLRRPPCPTCPPCPSPTVQVVPSIPTAAPPSPAHPSSASRAEPRGRREQ